MNVLILKKLSLFFLFVLFGVVVNSQQSLGYDKPPEGVSMGEIGKTTQSQILISGVPIYQWYRGCAPTALGMVVGFYDNQGFSDLVAGDAQTQTIQVNDMMASEGHYDDYSLPKDYYPNMLQDNSELGGAHSSNSIADYMQTSWSSRNNYWGWSWSSDIGPAFVQYALQQNENYIINTSNIYYNSDSWNYLKEEIDNNRPVVLLVDSSGNGSTDHFVTGIGYDETTHKYAIYNTWDGSIHWHEYRPMSSSYSWGVYNFTKFIVDNSLSINEVNDRISIFPNPTDGRFYIDTNTVFNNLEIEIYDSMGRFLFITKEESIDLRNYKTGVYRLKIIDDTSIRYASIIKK